MFFHHNSKSHYVFYSCLAFWLPNSLRRTPLVLQRQISLLQWFAPEAQSCSAEICRWRAHSICFWMGTSRHSPRRGNPLLVLFQTHIDNRQVRKRHAELGYFGVCTGLDNVRLPGDIPYKEWDQWHTLILTDEMARVVSHNLCYPGEPNWMSQGIQWSSLGSRKRQWNRCTPDQKFRDSGTKTTIPSKCS